MKRDELPSVANPPDVKVGSRWAAHMREMAAHIDAYATLLISENSVGRKCTLLPTRTGVSSAKLSGRKKPTLSRVYGGERFIVPLGRNALHRARRGPVTAAARARELTIGEAARILGMRRDYTSRLVNSPDETTDGATPVRCGSRKGDPRQIDMFPGE